MMAIATRAGHFAHAVVNDQPAVLGQDGRSSCADLEPSPRATPESPIDDEM